MSRPARRSRANHKKTAEALRARPGVWMPVGDYSSNISADGVCYMIRAGRTTSGVWYQPAGAFEAYMVQVDDGTRVHARYIGGAK